MSNSEVDELASMFKQQVPNLLWLRLLRLRRSQRQTLHGKIGLWWWGRKWLIHRQLTRMEIDSRGRQ
jgi:hypothetical protein